MNMRIYAQIFVQALFSRSLTFNFSNNGVRYNVLLTAITHNVPLGRLTFDQAAALAMLISTTQLPFPGVSTGAHTIRFGNTDYTVDIRPI